MDTKLANAWYSFDRYRDCSCGIVGYELTEELDSEGERYSRPILSPCETHPVLKYEDLTQEERSRVDAGKDTFA